MKTKHNLILYTFLFLLPFCGFAQNDLPSVWAQIERNNLTLQAVQQQVTALKIENKIGLTPENPEVEFAYLWGNPSAVGNRMDFSVTQSFDFPLVYAQKSKIANLKNEQSDLEYKKEQRAVYEQAGKLYYHIVYQNVRINDMQTCLGHLTGIAHSYQKKLEAGEITIFDYNKVRLTALNMEQELRHAETEREALLLELSQLNGGKMIDITTAEFPNMEFTSDFEQWYSQIEKNNPMLAWLHKEMEINEKQIRLSQASWAPQLMAGYMREQIPSESFQGIKVGITLPLWNNLNTIKQKKMQNSAINMMIYDEKNQFFNHLKTQFTLVSNLGQQIASYQTALEEISQFDLLLEALEKGEIDLVNYLLEYSIYHESHERLFEMQLDAAQKYLELQLYE
ncbi:MAG TPA: TolC family protein [Bacteroidales bacterium]|jgi:outer membrane protein, heavy metal efflux system|nr:TolC family protein [Bacteroidales bacterium]MDD4394886.1 TolC family protein [Bacteroidales bacterium]HNW68392.1 TolC family protein [Bacteroidales bacterium]HPT52610.1 TolC family protein [Bacteroidales bacterium]